MFNCEHIIISHHLYLVSFAPRYIYIKSIEKLAVQDDTVIFKSIGLSRSYNDIYGIYENELTFQTERYSQSDIRLSL